MKRIERLRPDIDHITDIVHQSMAQSRLAPQDHVLVRDIRYGVVKHFFLVDNRSDL